MTALPERLNRSDRERRWDRLIVALCALAVLVVVGGIALALAFGGPEPTHFMYTTDNAVYECIRLGGQISCHQIEVAP